MSRFDVRRSARLKELAACGPFVAASLCEVKRRCGNPKCKCARGLPHKAHVLTRKARGKTRTIHVPKGLVAEVRAWVKEYARVKRLVREVSEASLALSPDGKVIRANLIATDVPVGGISVARSGHTTSARTSSRPAACCPIGSRCSRPGTFCRRPSPRLV